MNGGRGLPRVLSVVGARPQFIKAAVVGQALCAAGIEQVLVHTGQHHDTTMSAVFFDELGIAAPDHQLGIHGGSHASMTGGMMISLEEVLSAERPDLVLVYGDTNSTLAGALTAAKLNLPVAHVEAGLRSFNRRMPEEVNRVIVDHLSVILFCPTSAARANLTKEGIVDGVHVVGDVMLDAVLDAGNRAKRISKIVERLGLQDGAYAVATLHRAETTDDELVLRSAVDWLKARAAELMTVLPLHPRLDAALGRYGLSLGAIRAIEPLGYIDMQRLLAGCTTVYTDSGGLQKEAYFHRKPCVTLRSETEWVETIECGWNRLWTGPAYAPRREIREYGDGKAATRIAEVLASSASYLRNNRHV